MRTEAIEKEAIVFNRDRECYVHIERTDGSPYAMVFSGDPVVLIQGIYNLLNGMERDYEIPYKRMIKVLKEAKKNDTPEAIRDRYLTI